LLAKTVGDHPELELPVGKITFDLLAIEFEEE
jgi:hypothetical protein